MQKGIVIGIAVAAIVILGILGYVIFHDSETNDNYGKTSIVANNPATAQNQNPNEGVIVTEQHMIDIRNFVFSPATLTIKKGEPTRLKNNM